MHAEIFFDPQTHTVRGVPMGAVILGLHRASEQARRQLGLTSGLILCFLRHLSEAEALQTLEAACPTASTSSAWGWTAPNATTRRPSSSVCLPGHARWACAWWRMPAKKRPAAYVEQALDLLQAERIDHGVRSIDDPP